MRILKKTIIIIVISMGLLLQGCIHFQDQKTTIKPIKPVIDTYTSPGFVCFTEEDATNLFRYILDLEARWD